jgi:hypothetical protein
MYKNYSIKAQPMAYKPVKQLLLTLITLFLTWQPTCHGMARMASIPATYYFFMSTHLWQAHRETFTLARQNLPKNKRSWLKCPDMHPDVQAFVREQLNLTPDKHLLDKLHFKQVAAVSTMAVTRGGIEINPTNHAELLSALTKKKNSIPLTQQEEDVISFHAVVCKHEFGHLKHQDLHNERLFLPAASIILQGLTWAFTKLCSCEKYYKPSSYTEDQWSIDIIKGGLFLAATGIAQGFIHKKLFNARSKYVERRAERYAIYHTRNAEILKGYVRYKSKRRVEKANKIADTIIEELQDIMSSRPYLKLYSHYIHRKFLTEYPDYKKSSYSREALAAFRTWLLQQDQLINKLQTTIYPSHPAHAEWIQEAEQAAEALARSPGGL